MRGLIDMVRYALVVAAGIVGIGMAGLASGQDGRGDTELDEIVRNARMKNPVDLGFRPKAGDWCLLGGVDWEAEKAGRLGHVYQADCYASYQAIQQAMAIDPAAERRSRYDDGPDCYRPRAFTAATVRDWRVVQAKADGEVMRIPVLRVEIMGGEFKDRLLWVPAYKTFRLKGREE